MAGVRAERVGEAVAAALRQQQAALAGPVAALLDECPAGVWPKLHGVVAGASEAAGKALLQVRVFCWAWSGHEGTCVRGCFGATLRALVMVCARPAPP